MSSATSSKPARTLWPVWLLLVSGLYVQSGRCQPPPDSARTEVPFTILHADQFVQRRDSTGLQRYLLQGDVHITRAGSTIKCDELIYYPDANYFLCSGRVLVADTSRSLSSDTLYYYVDSGYYKALGNLHWSSGEFTGTGGAGEYWREREIMAVTGDAAARDSLRLITAERLEYSYLTETLVATGNVNLTDRESHSTAVATAGVYRRSAGEVVLSGRPVVTYYAEDDTLHTNPYNLTGDRIVNWAGDSLAAAGRVRLAADSLTVTADSLFYDRKRNVSYFRGGPPVIEHPKYELRGQLLDVFSAGRALERVVAAGEGRGEFFSGESAGKAADSTLDSEAGSWIEGDSLELFFGAGALDSISSAGNARSYFRENAQAGINYLQGDRILLIWQEGALEVVEVTRGGRGLYLPPDSGGAITVIPDSAGFKTDSSKPRNR